MGLYICHDLNELKIAIEKSGDRDLIIEEFIKGEESYSGSFLKEEPLGVLKITPKIVLYDYKSKYTAGMTDRPKVPCKNKRKSLPRSNVHAT